MTYPYALERSSFAHDYSNLVPFVWLQSPQLARTRTHSPCGMPVMDLTGKGYTSFTKGAGPGLDLLFADRCMPQLSEFLAHANSAAL